MKAKERLGNAARRVARLGNPQFWIWLGTGTFFFWLFFELSENLFYDKHDATALAEMDRSILLSQEHFRRNWLTDVALDVTALGSGTVVVLILLFASILLLINRQKWAVVHLTIAALGASCLTVVVKNLLEKPRPSFIPRLQEATGYSFPSGHTLTATAVYLSLAIVVTSFQTSVVVRIGTFLVAFLTLVGVGWSRVYLGVHYPTDVMGGITLGSAWAFFVAAAFSYRAKLSREKIGVS